MKKTICLVLADYSGTITIYLKMLKVNTSFEYDFKPTYTSNHRSNYGPLLDFERNNANLRIWVYRLRKC